MVLHWLKPPIGIPIALACKDLEVKLPSLGRAGDHD